MIKANIFEIKAKLSEYLDRAARGDRVVIYRHNKAIAEIRGVEAELTEPRPIGPLPGRPVFKVPASFFEPLSDHELNQWEGVDIARPDSAEAKPRGGLQRAGKQSSRRKTK